MRVYVYVAAACCALVHWCSRQCSAEIFTAMAEMEIVLGAERQATSVIDAYIEAEHRRLERLKE